MGAAGEYDAEQRSAWAARGADPGAWRTRLASLETFVAIEGGAPAGFLALAEPGHVELLFVAPEHTRRGVATALWRHAEARLRQRRNARVTTDASLVARPFFERQGFTVCSEEQVRVDGVELRRFAMERTLGPEQGA